MSFIDNIKGIIQNIINSIDILITDFSGSVLNFKVLVSKIIQFLYFLVDFIKEQSKYLEITLLLTPVVSALYLLIDFVSYL
jgi:hypothetical protein